MTDGSNAPKVLHLALRPAAFQDRLRLLATDTKNIFWSRHARDRMEERGIPNRVALEVLRRGILVGEVEAGVGPGEWKGKIVRTVKGRREVGVVCLLMTNQDRIFVKTVEWEDMR